MESNNNGRSRRDFLKRGVLTGAGAAIGIGTAVTPGWTFPVLKSGSSDRYKPAILGGKPAYNGTWPDWPVWNSETDEKRIIEVLRSGVWSRNKLVAEFEEKWAAAVGAKRCLAVVNGTNALIASLVQSGIGGGDEVIVPAYTFIATVAAVLATGAIPVFVDTDRETFQIDPRKIEEKITPQTRAILPVHILGLPADMISILEIAGRHDLLVIEDACQGWLAEINGKKVGTFGHAGCFSFQNSKNLAIGEGGAIVSEDDEFMDRCYSYHNYGMPYGTMVGAVGTGSVMAGTKLRLTEYQAAIGLTQLARLEEETAKRNENAAYLTGLISDIPGIIPYKLYHHVTRAAFHLFPFRFHKEEFRGLSRSAFLKALDAEGIPCSGGYAPLNDQPYLAQAFQTKNFRKMYSAEMLDIDKYHERNRCPENDRLCHEEAVWIPQNVLLGTRADMDAIAGAIARIRTHADRIQE